MCCRENYKKGETDSRRRLALDSKTSKIETFDPWNVNQVNFSTVQIGICVSRVHDLPLSKMSVL